MYKYIFYSVSGLARDFRLRLEKIFAAQHARQSKNRDSGYCDDGLWPLPGFPEAQGEAQRSAEWCVADSHGGTEHRIQGNWNMTQHRRQCLCGNDLWNWTDPDIVLNPGHGFPQPSPRQVLEGLCIIVFLFLKNRRRDDPFENMKSRLKRLNCAPWKGHRIGETGCNSNTFCFGNSGTETIWDKRLLFTRVQTLVIWLYSSCKNIWKCQHQVVEIRLRKNDYRCYNRPRMRRPL